MSKQYFFMNLAYWLNLKIKINLNGKKETGILLTPKNQFGDFYLIDKKSKDILLSGKTSKVKSVSFDFSDFYSQNNSTNLNLKIMKKKSYFRTARFKFFAFRRQYPKACTTTA